MKKLARVVKVLKNAVGVVGLKSRERLQPRFRLVFFLLALAVFVARPAYGQTYLDLHDFGAGVDGTRPLFGVAFDRSGNMYGTVLSGGSNGEDAGLVWEITAAGQYKVLHVFGEAGDGNDPKGGVTIDGSGNLYGTTTGGGATGGGMVWEITTTGKYLDLHDFGASGDGLGPQSEVMVDRSGNLYGTTFFTTSDGNAGSVWEITAAGKYIHLHDFGSAGDGANPFSRVTIDSSGNLYGTTYAGGAHNGGVVWEITASGRYTDLHDFGADGDGAQPLAGVTIDSAGNLYGTAPANGGSGNGPGMIWEITNSGRYVDVHDFGATGDGAQPNAGVTLDGAGNLYGTATNGGAYSGGVLWTIAGGAYHVLHSFGSGSDGVNPWAAISIDASGNLYGTTYNGGANGTQCGMLWEFAGISLSGLAVSPTSVLGGNSATGTVSLSGPAPSGGLTIGLSSSNSSAKVPSTVAVGSGQTSATFQIQTSAVLKSTDVTITAKLGAATQTATLTIEAPLLSGIRVNPTSVVGGDTSTGIVTLSQGAPSDGLVVSLTSSSVSASLPATVSVPGGLTSASFSITTTSVSSTVNATISATNAGTTVKTTLTIKPASSLTLTLNPPSVVGGNSSTGTVSLSSPAGSGGAVVVLSSGNSSATVPASVKVPSGSSSASFSVSTSAVNSQTSAVITATLNSVSQTATLTITPLSLVGLTLNPSSVNGGVSSAGTVTLNGPAGSGGSVVTLTSSNSAATLPASVKVAFGQRTATFTIGTAVVSTVTTSTITASLNGTTQQATLTIGAAPALASVSVNPPVVTGPAEATGTVTLTSPAGSLGLVVGLSSSNSAALLPHSVTIVSGQASTTFTVKALVVTVQTSATLTANLGGQKATTVLTVVPVTLASFSFNPVSVMGGSTSTGTVALSGPAPKGGLGVKLSSSLSNVSVPGSVTVATGKTSATFTAKTTAVSAQRVATVTAKLGSVSLTATLTLTPPSISAVSLNQSTVIGGASATGVVLLTGPAGTGGFAVQLSSSSTAAMVPASLTIPSGKRSANFTVKTVALAAKVSATISASANGQTGTATLTIIAPVLKSLSLNPASVKGGKSSTGTVVISSAAPSGGLVVTLSSSQSSASVPTTVTIPAGRSSATFTVNTTAVDSKSTATIGATLGGTSKTAALTIRVSN